MNEQVLEGWDRSISQWQEMNVLVIGDCMLDIERHCATGTTFNEFGTYALKEAERRLRPGGAANLAVNLKRMGCAQVDLIGAISDDVEGHQLIDLLVDEDVNVLWRHPYQCRSFRGTTVKERIYLEGQPLHRIDRDVINELPVRQVIDNLLMRNRSLCYDVMLFSDYQKGAFVVRAEIEQICRTFRELNPDGFITANLKPRTIRELYTDWKNVHVVINLIQLNDDEMVGIVGEQEPDPSGRIIKMTGCGHVLHTMGARGLRLVDENGDSASVLGYRIKKGSTVGAGDTTLAAATLAMHSETSLEAQVMIANAAGAARVERTDRQWITTEDVLSILRRRVY